MSVAGAPNSQMFPGRRQPPTPGGQYRDKNTGQSYSYGQTGPNGEMGYSPDSPVNIPMPQFHMDPNSGSNYQWDPIQGQFKLESTADVRRGEQDADFNADLSHFERLKSHMPMDRTGLNVTSSSSMVPRATLDTGAISAGDSAAFSRAKDQVGDAQRGLMSAMKNQFASRGLRGSSIEGRAVGSGLERGFGQLADVSREQAIQGSNRAVDLAKTAYQGDITQRGQDMDAASQAKSLAWQNSQAKQSALTGLWSAVRSRSGGGSMMGGAY